MVLLSLTLFDACNTIGKGSGRIFLRFVKNEEKSAKQTTRAHVI
jgi:hypothetical protein